MKSALVALLAAPLLMAAKTGMDEPTVQWRGEARTVKEIEEGAGRQPAKCVGEWAAWAAEREYRLELDDTGRVLILVKADEKLNKRRRELIEKAVELIEETLVPEVDEEEEEKRRSRRPRPIPTVTVIQFDNRKDFHSGVARLSRDYKHLAEWAESMKPFSSFLIENPLCTGWTEKEEGAEHYDPANMCANHLSRLLVEARFGRLPHWMKMGFSWHFEYELLGNLYTFPYRQVHLGRVPNEGWDTELRKEFRKRKTPLALAEMAEWESDQFDGDAAARGWGLVRFLVKQYPEQLPEALERLGRLCHRKGGRNDPERGWVWNEPTAQEQTAIFHQVFGSTVFAEATEAFGKKR